jgi:hypothetical protein
MPVRLALHARINLTAPPLRLINVPNFVSIA